MLGGAVGGRIALRAWRERWQHTAAVQPAPAPDPAPGVPALLAKKDEAAARLGIGLRTLERLLSTGELRPVRVGRAVRLVIAELDSYVLDLQQRRDG